MPNALGQGCRSEPPCKILQFKYYMYLQKYILTFQGVHCSQNLNSRGNALIPNCEDLFLFCRSSIEFGDKVPSKLRSGPSFCFQARVWVYSSCFLMQKNMRKVWGYTSELMNGQKAPMNKKFGKPLAIVFHQHLNSYIPYPYYFFHQHLNSYIAY